MAKKIGIAVIGCGRIGRVHAANLANLTGTTLTFVYDAMPQAAKKLGAELNAQVADSVEQIFADDATQAVIICSPTPTHIQLIKQAVLAGKKILCEKPLTRTLKESISCMDFVAKHKAILMVGFNRPYDPGVYALRQRVAKGEVGNIEHVQITSRDPAAPPMAYLKLAGGIFLDMMIHDFEMALRLLPDKPVALSAMASAITDKAIGKIGDHDNAVVTMHTAAGATCSIHNCRRAAYGYDQRVEVAGSKGMLQAQNLHEDNLISAGSKGFAQAPLQHFFLERYNQSYRTIVNTFVAAIGGNKKALEEVRTTNGVNAIYLAEQAAISAKSGKTVKLKLPYAD
ncbi:MAG: inositol 2-dehydrogenase [Candidatus Portiera sp.]|nr:inositol 2-dehydrogenase [Portiera sp.]